MIPVIGLGNQVKKYINSRHNVGWHVLDMLSGNQNGLMINICYRIKQ